MLNEPENKKGILCNITTARRDGEMKYFVNILENNEPESNLLKIPIDEFHIFYAEKKDMRQYNYF